MTLPMTTLEAFAAIPLAAVCCDQTFGKDEAHVIREQLLGRTAYREMEPYAFGLLISGLLKRFREESWQGLIASAAPLLSREQQEMAFALACQLIHCDRIVTPGSNSSWWSWRSSCRSPQRVPSSRVFFSRGTVKSKMMNWLR